MENFKQRFEIIYKKYAEGLDGTGAKPNTSAFARFLELPISTVKSWEARNVVPAGKDLKTIHDKLGFAFTWLISGEGEMFDEAAKVLEEQKAEIARKDAEIARLTAENRRLTTQLFMEGGSTEESAGNTGNAAGQG